MRGSFHGGHGPVVHDNAGRFSGYRPSFYGRPVGGFRPRRYYQGGYYAPPVYPEVVIDETGCAQPAAPESPTQTDEATDGAAEPGAPADGNMQIEDQTPGADAAGSATVSSGAVSPTGGTGRGSMMTGTLADLFPILAPGSRGMSVKVHIGPDQILRATLCIDGRCYGGSYDLGSLYARALNAHAALHAAGAGESVNARAAYGASPEGKATAAIAAGTLLGAMVDEHCAVISAGWFDSITHAVSSAVHGIGSAASSVGSGIAHTLKKLKAPIQVAAAGAAVAFVGPQAGPLAAQLSGSLIDAANGDGDAKQVVQAAQQAAQSNPTVAKALDAAHQAVSSTTAGFHVIDTAAKAAQGDMGSAAQIAQIAQQAAGGDAGAASAMQLAQQAMSMFGGGGDAGAAAVVSSGAFPFLPFAGLAGAGVGGYLLWKRHQKQRAIALAAQANIAIAQGIANAHAIANAQQPASK